MQTGIHSIRLTKLCPFTYNLPVCIAWSCNLPTNSNLVPSFGMSVSSVHKNTGSLAKASGIKESAIAAVFRIKSIGSRETVSNVL